jgi:aerobic carbon-monoxide dehydrogenase medium subunit
VTAASLDEAIALLADGAGAAVVVGGQSLIPAMSVRRVAPTMLVDIGGIAGLRGIGPGGAAGGVRVGATTTLADIAADGSILKGWTALAEAAEAAGDAQVRNRGTLGGSLADAHPAGDLLAAAIALDGVLNISGPDGTRQVDAADLLTGPYATVLQSGDIITSLDLPAVGPGRGSAYVKQRHPGSGYAVCGVAAALTLATGGQARDVRIAATGAAGHPGRLHGAEEAASGLSAEEAADAAEAAVWRSRPGFVSDLSASAAYRKHLAGVLTGRAIRLAGQRGGGA